MITKERTYHQVRFRQVEEPIIICLSHPTLPCYPQEKPMEYKSKGKMTLVLGSRECGVPAARDADSLKQTDPVCFPVRTRKGAERAVLWILKLLPLLTTCLLPQKGGAGRHPHPCWPSGAASSLQWVFYT